ncbi:MAG TPA: glycosyltransferase family 4 protein [Usitatibacteraceae bacterium]|nr:glycosyltransferase family 4 protein [Usitatibacteraceae bacterium]
MKIALVRARYNPFGGAERFLNAAAEALVAGGERVAIVTREWPANANAAIEHRIVNPRYVTSTDRDAGFARGVRALLGRERFDLVQSYERLPDVDVFHAVDGVHAEWLVQRARVQGAIKRWSVRLSPHHRHVLKAERSMYTSPRLKAVICISEMVKRNVVGHYGVAADKCHVIYGAIDCEHFHPGLCAAHRGAQRAAHGIPADAPLAIFVGSGFERKGAAAFLEVIAAVDGLHGVVVGADKRLEQHRALARKLGIGKRVVFTGGIRDVRPWYGAADLFLMPTLYEPFGLVFGEAMACGLPVITSPQAGAADWVRHGENGFVIDPLDVSAMASAACQALGNAAMGARARSTVLPYTVEATAQEYRSLYRRLLAA